MHCHKTKIRWALLGIVLTFAGIVLTFAGIVLTFAGIMMVSKDMAEYSTLGIVQFPELGIVSGIIVSGIGFALIACTNK